MGPAVLINYEDNLRRVPRTLARDAVLESACTTARGRVVAILDGRANVVAVNCRFARAADLLAYRRAVGTPTPTPTARAPARQ